MASGGSLTALWTEVNRCGQTADYSRALKSLNRILQDDKDDVTALHCKVVCLVHNGNFKEALNIIHTHTKVLSSDVIAFEKAYCEYRLNRIETALKTIESVEQRTNKLKELYAQVLYRLERYEDCLTVYRDLIRNSQDDYEEERKTNLSAVVAALSTWQNSYPEDLGLPETSYELCYNAACTLIGEGKLSLAMNKLQKAEELCRQSFSEDTDQNVFDSKKKVKLTNAEGVEHKLTHRQLQAIEVNKALLAMHTNQADQCRKLTLGLQKQNPETPLPVLIQAAQMCREKQHSKAIQLLEDFLEQHPENAFELKMTIAQLYLVQGHVTKACDILRSIDEKPNKLGMVSALVTMYSHEEDIDSAIEVFSQAIQWYQEYQPNTPAHLLLVREAANFKLKYGRQKEAISDLEQLWRQNSQDVRTLAQLISAYSLVDSKKAKTLSKHLPSLEAMSFKVDVDALENSHGATYIRKKAGKVAGESQLKERGQGDIKKKKKKKRGKLPKNFDPKVPADPERWLPMRERSYYRGRKKGKKKEPIGKGTQGATSSGASELDASKMVNSPPTSPRPGTVSTVASSSNIVPPRQQKPSAASKKKQQQKKKKGGKGGW
ncbi:signal recognition particle subunit SRP72 isoform X2 [Hemitrygon akajei]|uniref:signal recognition particle subunit SRP72 isoform X2 n=1 Tax=Hemitrygon akajei TaxID=2704970 RepID=UPI003BF97880